MDKNDMGQACATTWQKRFQAGQAEKDLSYKVKNKLYDEHCLILWLLPTHHSNVQFIERIPIPAIGLDVVEALLIFTCTEQIPQKVQACP